MGAATSGGMSPWRKGSTWMACSRVKSASSGRKPKVSARATSPGMGGISMTASVATGAWVRADVRSTAAAKTATANARRMALPRTARGTGSIVQAPNRRPKKEAGVAPSRPPPRSSLPDYGLQVHVVLVVGRLARRVVRVGRAVAAPREHARVARDAPLADGGAGASVPAPPGLDRGGARALI